MTAMLQRLVGSHGRDLGAIRQLLHNTSRLVGSTAPTSFAEKGEDEDEDEEEVWPVPKPLCDETTVNVGGNDVNRCFKTDPPGSKCCFLINVGWADAAMKAYGADTDPAVSFSKSPLFGARTEAEAKLDPAQEYFDQPLTFGLDITDTGFDKVQPNNWGPLQYIETKQFVFPYQAAKPYADGGGQPLYLTVSQNGQEVCNTGGASNYNMFRILTFGNYWDVKRGKWGRTSNVDDVLTIDYQSYVQSDGRKAGDPMYFTVVPCRDNSGSGQCETFDPSGISLVMISFRKPGRMPVSNDCQGKPGVCCVVEKSGGSFDVSKRKAAFRTGGIGARCFRDGRPSDDDIQRPYLQCSTASGTVASRANVRYIQFMGGLVDIVGNSKGKDITIILKDRVSVYVSVGTLFAQWKVFGNTCDSLCTSAGGFPNVVDLLDDGGQCRVTSGSLFQSTSTGTISIQGFGRIDGYFIWFKTYWKSSKGRPRNAIQMCGRNPEKFCKAIPGTGGPYSLGQYLYEGAWYVDSGLLQLSSAAPKSRGVAISAEEVSLMNGLDRGDGGLIFQQPFFDAGGYAYQLAMVDPTSSCANYDNLWSSILVQSGGSVTKTSLSAVKALGNWWYQADGPDQYAPKSTSQFVMVQACDDSLKPHQEGTITDATVLQGGLYSGGSAICPCCYSSGWVSDCGDIQVSRVHVPFTYHGTDTWAMLAPKWKSGMQIYNQLYRSVIIDDLGYSQSGDRNSRIGRAVAVNFDDGSGMRFNKKSMMFYDWKAYPAAETSDESGSLLVYASSRGNAASYGEASFDVTGLAVTLDLGGGCSGLAWACLGSAAPTSACFVGTGKTCAPHQYRSNSKPACNGKQPPASTSISCQGMVNCQVRWAWKDATPTGLSGC